MNTYYPLLHLDMRSALSQTIRNIIRTAQRKHGNHPKQRRDVTWHSLHLPSAPHLRRPHSPGLCLSLSLYAPHQSEASLAVAPAEVRVTWRAVRGGCLALCGWRLREGVMSEQFSGGSFAVWDVRRGVSVNCIVWSGGGFGMEVVCCGRHL